MARRSDVIWHELSLVLQRNKPAELKAHLRILNRERVHPLFKAALDAQILATTDSEGALERLVETAKKRKLGPHEVLLRGLILYERGDFEEAWPSLDVAKNKGIADGRLDLARAGILVKRNELDQAREILKKTLEQSLNQWRAWLMLGSIEVKRKKLKAARDAFLVVTRLAPNFEPGWTHAAGVLVDLGELERAAETLRRICDIRPAFVTAHLGLVHVLQQLGLHKEAADRLRTVGRYAREPRMLLQIARYMMENEQYEDAAKILNHAQEHAEKMPELWYVRAELARAAGPEGRANAIQHYREALIRDPDFKDARVALDKMLAEI